MSTPVLTPEQRRDAEFGMAWWNNLTEPERSKWLTRADSAVPADAWAEFKRSAARPWLEFRRASQLNGDA